MLEAMAMAKPVIVTNTGGMAEVMNDSTGILVEPKNDLQLATVKLLREPDRRSELGKNARIHVEKNYSWKGIAGKYVNEYEKLVISNKKG